MFLQRRRGVQYRERAFHTFGRVWGCFTGTWKSWTRAPQTQPLGKFPEDTWGRRIRGQGRRAKSFSLHRKTFPQAVQPVNWKRCIAAVRASPNSASQVSVWVPLPNVAAPFLQIHDDTTKRVSQASLIQPKGACCCWDPRLSWFGRELMASLKCGGGSLLTMQVSAYHCWVALNSASQMLSSRLQGGHLLGAGSIHREWLAMTQWIKTLNILLYSGLILTNKSDEWGNGAYFNREAGEINNVQANQIGGFYSSKGNPIVWERFSFSW